ncbi:hypothetical protein GGH94_002761 [Coemansia aciculifera]|uniref:P-type phospholipid transporter n=1 Tax=Coemansia aciculifera TaxID=417176 RepID=A0A9W8IKL6_9FUNG|nr:hypothetical protein GGH94_002761 [Coemansia aciculifera]
MGRTANRNSSSGSNVRHGDERTVERQAAPITIDTAMIMRRASMDASAVSATTPGNVGVQGGRMTKLTHYGRMRSVTARALRLADPRAAAAALQTAAATTASHQRTAVMGEDLTAGEELLGRMRTRSRRFVRRRVSTGSVPTGLSRPASGEWAGGIATRMSLDTTAAAMGVAPASADSPLNVAITPGPILAAAPESSIGIPMPGFFLDAASDEWSGGHSFRQRLRFPDETVTVPASLTKRVHYEVSYDYPKNAISTARYNVVTFLPAQFAAQFSKVANVYFLFIAALQQVPGWSTTGRWSTVLPLCIFVSLSIAHEGFDDLRRHRMDHAENAQRTRVLKVKVHDQDHVAFNFRGLRHRGSQSIHSFRMRSSQSIHDIGRSTVAKARRWSGAVIGAGASIRHAIGSRIDDSRRKKREQEDSDDDDEAIADAPAGDRVSHDDSGSDNEALVAGATLAESLLRRRIGRGVASLRSWRSSGPGSPAMPHTPKPGVSSPLAGACEIDVIASPAEKGVGPTVAFNDVVEEVPAADSAAVNPLPSNMSCRWKRKRWENVQVGDLLMISKDDWIPADCIVVASSGFDGTCFVETAALDGETTLKQKQALDATNAEIQTPEQLAAFNAFTYVEPPSPELYTFEGFMEIGGRRFPLTPNQLLLRGSVLRNTAYVYAQVVYAGEHTRLRLNATRNVRTKAPQTQRITNRIVVLVFLLLLVLCLIFSALGIHWHHVNHSQHWYLAGSHMPATALIFGYIVMMNALIPISLYVTLEAVKIFQCWFIQQDVSMYHAESDSRAEARTTAINEDLGMVRYVFSDKTGTLTENIMKLRAVMVAGFSYLHMDLDRLQATNVVANESVATDERNSSRLSFMRPPSSAAGNGLQSPTLRRTQMAAAPTNLFHRRQQSLPASAPIFQGLGTPIAGARTLQQLAVTNRAAAGTSAGRRSPFGHSRGLSSAAAAAVPPPSSSLRFSPARLEESLAADDDADADADPDLVDTTGNGPEAHTPAADDAPVSDLQALPSSRTIMDGLSPPTDVFRSRAEWFLRCLALCHTVQPDRDPLTGRITGYQATSPDEKALVAAAAELGYVMNNRAGPLVQLRVVASERMRDFSESLANEILFNSAPPPSAAKKAENESFDRGVPAPDPTDRLGNYEVLDVLEFSSARKRMSVIYRCPDGRIVMMSKGADSALWPRLANLESIRSDPADVSFIPRPPPPAMAHEGPLPALRRKLSHPSAAYLHSRNSSVASQADFVRSMATPDTGTPFAGEPLVPLSPSGLAHPQRVASRLGHRGGPAYDDDDGGSEHGNSQHPYYSPLTGGADDSDYDMGGTADDELGQMPLPSPLILPAYASPRSPFRQVARQQHRRLMSDSQFSAFSEASSFGDTQGHIEMPPSFSTPSREEEEWARGRALEALHQFSTEGLRTLVYAHREVPADYYESWHQRHLAASTALVSRQQQVEAVCEEIERDLMLSGISAIEDRLQAGVPETIFKLRRAGIRVWMLTGDKVETAINIGKSCRLIDTEVVEQTKLDMALASGQSGKMTLLVMQSMTDYDALNRLITEALDVARSLVLSVDERFERLTRRQRLARGFKRFGNMFDPRRLRYRKDHECGTVAGGDCPEPAGQQAKSEGYPDDKGRGDHPSLTSSSIAAATSAVGNVYHGAPPTEIEWADTVGCATPTTLGVGARPDTTGASPIHPTCPVIERASSAATTSVSHEKLPANSPAQPPPLEGSSSSSSSMRTRGVDEKPSGPGEALPPAVGNGGASLAVVIDGETLATLEEHADKGVLDRFLTLGTLCDAVICSRVSPSQKALIVHNMRVRCEGGGTNSSARKSWWRRCLNPMRDLFTHDNDKYMVTLAIGDGGNDIAMIQEAHVGIGIAGQEGLQASRAADFSIGQFRFLQKLLLVHGRWSYVRVSMFIMGTFYKCMAFYATQLIFQFYTGFSGTSLFESWTLSMYNTLFSILPVLVVGIFEQDLQPETLLAYPELYRDMGPRNHLFTVPLFLWRVVFIGIVHAVTAAFFPFAANLALGAHSSSNDLYITGFVVYSIMVLIVTFKIAYIDVRRWVIFSHLSVILTLAVWFGWNGVLNHVYPQSPGSGYNVLGVFHLLMKEGAFWFEWIIFVAIALCLNVLIKTVYSVRDPVEHRIMTWVACERRQESAKHKMERRQWFSNLGARNPIRSIGLMVGRNTGGRPRSHSE